MYVQNVSGALSGRGAKWQISSSGGAESYWRCDGKELFYLNGNKVMAVDVNGSSESFQAGIPHELFETPLAEFRKNRYVATRDGKRFLLNVPGGRKAGTEDHRHRELSGATEAVAGRVFRWAAPRRSSRFLWSSQP